MESAAAEATTALQQPAATPGSLPGIENEQSAPLVVPGSPTLLLPEQQHGTVKLEAQPLVPVALPPAQLQLAQQLEGQQHAVTPLGAGSAALSGLSAGNAGGVPGAAMAPAACMSGIVLPPAGGQLQGAGVGGDGLPSYLPMGLITHSGSVAIAAGVDQMLSGHEFPDRLHLQPGAGDAVPNGTDMEWDAAAAAAAPVPSGSASSSVGGEPSGTRTGQQGQSTHRGSSAAGGGGGGSRGGRKPHLQGRFSGRLATKDDEKRLTVECRLLGPLLGGVGKRGDSSRLTLAKIVRGIASGEVRKFCEERERAFKGLRQRLAHLEGLAAELAGARAEAAQLRDRISELEATLHGIHGPSLAVGGGRDSSGGIGAPAGGSAVLLDTAMPQALDMHPGALGIVAPPLPPLQSGHHAINGGPHTSGGVGGGVGLGATAAVVAATAAAASADFPGAAPPVIRTMDSFTSTAATELSGAGRPAGSSAPLFGSAPALSALVVSAGPGRDGSLDGAAGVTPLGAPAVPASVPAASTVAALAADAAMLTAGQLGASPALVGPSPSLVPQPGLPDDGGGTTMALSMPAGMAGAGQAAMGTSQALGTGLSPAVADPVAATTQVAVQVAQAAHAVQQQAASLQVAAEIHAAKAHAATSQVASLQATAQVIAATHDELVKKIEDVKQTAVAQIQQPQPVVPPEEVVKHAQKEVQKLEAQAQAQAIAAVQVSAAAQRAEAEAQKHMVVHAQVAAQAQQLQAKAVHLQAHAEQLTTTAAATEAVVAAATGGAGGAGGSAGGAVVSPSLLGGVSPEAAAFATAAAAVASGSVAPPAALAPAMAVPSQQQGLPATSPLGTGAVVMPSTSHGVIQATPPAALQPLQCPSVAATSMAGASAIAAAVVTPTHGAMQTSPTMAAMAAMAQGQQQQQQGSTAVQGGETLLGVGAMQGAAAPCVPGPQQAQQQLALAQAQQQAQQVQQLVQQQQQQVQQVQQQQQQQQHLIVQQHVSAQPALSTSSQGQQGASLPGSTSLGGPAASLGMPQQAALDAAMAAHTAAQQVAKLEAATAAAAVASMQQQAVQAQLEHAAAAAAAAQQAASIQVQQHAQLQAEHAAAAAAAAAASMQQQQQHAVAYTAAVHADAAAAAAAAAAAVAAQTSGMTQPPLGGALLPPLPPGAAHRDGSMAVASNAVTAAQVSAGGSLPAGMLDGASAGVLPPLVESSMNLGAAPPDGGLGGAGGGCTGMPRVESSSSVQAVLQQQQHAAAVAAAVQQHAQMAAEAAQHAQAVQQQQQQQQQQAAVLQAAALQQATLASPDPGSLSGASAMLASNPMGGLQSLTAPQLPIGVPLLAPAQPSAAPPPSLLAEAAVSCLLGDGGGDTKPADPIEAQLAARLGSEAGALDLDVLLDPDSIQSMMDAPTPGAASHTVGGGSRTLG